jgi:membrane protein
VNRKAKLAFALMEGQLSKFIQIGEDVAKATGRNRLTLAAAGLAFHGFLAIFPALIAAVGLARLVGLTSAQLTAVIHNLTILLPRSTATILVGALRSSGSRRADLIAVIVGIAVAAWSSIEAIAALQQALDVAFGVGRVHGFVLRRLRAIPLLGVTVVLGVIAVGLVVFGSGIERIVATQLPTPLHSALEIVGWVIRVFGAVAAITLLLSIYYGVAKGRSWKDWRVLSVGSLVATVGWIAVSFGYSIYLTHSTGESVTYGPLAGVAILLLWLYLSFVVILVGGEIDHVLESDGSGAQELED